MAIDQQNKRRNLATRMMNDTNNLMTALAGLKAAKDEYTQAGLTFQDSDFIGTSLAHIDAASMSNLLSSIDALASWLTSTNHEDNFYKVKP